MKLLLAAVSLSLAAPAAAGLAEAQASARELIKQAVTVSGRAPTRAVSQAASARACWQRAADAQADALGMARVVCVDSVRVEGESLVVAGTFTGRFRLLWGVRATVFSAYRSEGACESGESASISITPEGRVEGSVGESPDVCHSGFQERDLAFTRVP
ncbi:MAG: hypothetical protein SF051_11070 [Elusimicrobiota bacterium]|nr:hypothetical protein [Elusimicrobiota bacterium]